MSEIRIVQLPTQNGRPVTEVLRKFIAATEKPYARLGQWKEDTGKRVIGCHPMDVPEEILHAAGLLPIILMGSDEPITLADRCLQPTIACNILRGNLDLMLKGRLDFLDGIVFADICDVMPILSDIWRKRHTHPIHHLMVMPKHLNARSSLEHLSHGLRRLKTAVEQLAGEIISDEALRRSIALYNQNRRLLTRLYDFRRANPGLIRAGDISSVLAASMLMPKEDHNQLLTGLLRELEGVEMARIDARARLIISGSFCGQVDGILKLVDDLGAVVVDDDLYVGSRYFATLANETPDPIEALAERYVKDMPSPTRFYEGDDYGQYLLRMVTTSRANGVVIIMRKFCDVHAMDYPCLERALSSADVPQLLIEAELGGISEQTHTKLQAFIEMLGEVRRGN